ncbi:hypothetical protein [Leptolyngbya sp. BC1307]|uniref:hypothetical protein n=1 Tax=Leptolyngbya sp. BC1307 TaxID=2029589 RepID=UPI001F0AE60A|nr:hypothetical protein [Leptolyngbya sp. BC1307]
MLWPDALSRTGYTGELGYELFVDPGYGAQLWDLLMKAGKPAGLLPLGMAALDRARIEVRAYDWLSVVAIAPHQLRSGGRYRDYHLATCP